MITLYIYVDTGVHRAYTRHVFNMALFYPHSSSMWSMRAKFLCVYLFEQPEYFSADRRKCISVHVECSYGYVSASLCLLSVVCLSVCAVRCLFATDRRPLYTRDFNDQRCCTKRPQIFATAGAWSPHDRRCTVARPNATRGSRTDTIVHAFAKERGECGPKIAGK